MADEAIASFEVEVCAGFEGAGVGRRDRMLLRLRHGDLAVAVGRIWSGMAIVRRHGVPEGAP